MEQIKQRDYMFDTFRGLCMWAIPISHFTRVAGSFHQDSLSGIIYITINVFVMQAFVFLSGYFSKKPDRAKQTAFKTFLWPLWVCTPFFFCVRYIIWGKAHFYFDMPPFALWYLFALFFYRFFLKEYIRIPHIFAISMVIYLTAGQVAQFSDTWALGRIVSYFPFFLIGYYCNGDHLKIIQTLKNWQCWILGIVLLGISAYLAFVVKLPVGYYLLKGPAAEVGVSWYMDIIGRVMIFVLACAWIVLMVNILPNKMNYVAYVGMNTMPVYVLHLIVRYEIKKHGITFGIFPENTIVYYILIFAFASLCVLVFSSKPISKGYDWVIESLYKVFMMLVNGVFAILGYIDKGFIAGTYKLLSLFKNAPGAKDYDKKNQQSGK